MAELSKVNVNSTDYDLKDQKSRDVLVEVVDNGAKNLSQFNSGTAAADNTTIATGVQLVGHAGEVLVISYETALSSGIITIGFKDANGTATGSVEIGNVTKQKIVTIPEGTAKFNVFVSKAGTYTNFMICTKAEWDISQAYVPYGKTNAELTSDVSALSAENTRQETEIGVVANAGAKNLIPINNLTTIEDSYCSWTVNADSSITVTPKSAPLSADWTKFVVNNFVLPAGTYIMSGGIAETSTSNKCDTYIANIDVNPAVTIARGWTDGYQTFTLMQPTHIRFAIRIKTSYNSTTPVIFKPMIRPAAITDPTFQPYAKTNRELTVLTDEDRAALVEMVDNGAKNLLNSKDAENYLTQGTFPINKTNSTWGLSQDGTITATTTTVLNATVVRIPITLPAGSYHVGGSPASGSDTSYRVDLRNPGLNTFIVNDYDYGNGIDLTLSSETAMDYCMRIGAGYDNKTVTFSPIICTKTQWNISHKYVPYKQDITWGFGDKIPQNSDFNSYTIPGVYRVENSTDAATMIHIPATGGGGRLEVKAANALNRIIQTYYISTTTFTRYYNGTTWSDWVQILSTATLDEIPTANSTNAVMSGGIWTDQQRQETEIGVVANAGAKNLFAITAQSDIKQGVRFTVNDDGTVTVNRESAGTAGAFFTVGEFTGDSGQMYTLNGCPATGSDSTYYMYVGSSYRDYGSGVTREGGTLRNVVIYVDINYSPDNLTFKPMIRPAAITDPTFQPYAKTNRELTVLTDEDRAALVEMVDCGSKNIVDLSKTTFTTNTKDGVTVTRSGDTFTVTGTGGASTNNFFNLYYSPSTVLIPTGTWVFALVGTGLDNIRLEVSDNVSPDVQKGAYGENPFICTVPAGITKSYFRICTKAGASFTNTSFKIMICTKAAWQISKTYQPYRPSWQEMWDAIQELQSGGNRALTMQTEPEEQEER